MEGLLNAGEEVEDEDIVDDEDIRNIMLKKLFASQKSSPPSEGQNYLLEEYLQNASLSLLVAIKQLHYASAWLQKYHADAMDVDVLLETLKVHADELTELQKRYQ